MKYTADFETTTDERDCRVWACGICSIGNGFKFEYSNSIEGFINFARVRDGSTFYFHNLKFDGEFIINYLFKNGYSWIPDRRGLKPKSFTTLISDKGIWYSMEICFDNGSKCTILDSLKIIPFSVADIARAFSLDILKGSIDYDSPREIGHNLTEDEVAYLKNDVEIPARALNTLFSQNLKQMTQGSNALHDYKHTIGVKNFKRWFPNLEYDAYIRKSYKGGFTYCNPKYKLKDVGKGIVLDVNSLYPSVMYYKPLPYGEGIQFKGKYKADKDYPLYVQRLKCAFDLKEGYLPTIQIKNSLAFNPTEYLTSSDDETIELTLTNVDLELFLEHYDVYNITYLDGYKFKASTMMFREYIDKWNKVKVEATLSGNTGMRTLAKLMLNALYGKFGLNPKVCSKIPYISEGIVKYRNGDPEERDPLYIPVATFITSWARHITITSAQKVYGRFIYADTDSLHLEGVEIPEGLEVSGTKLGAWKHEATFDRARFIRQKSYIEEIDGKLYVTCAGLPARCHDQVTWDNFKPHASYSGKLQYSHVKGGIVLKDIDFTIKV